MVQWHIFKINLVGLANKYCRLLHHCELTLQKLFKILDGVSSGPNSYSGPIGKLASTDVRKKPSQDFEVLGIENYPNLLTKIKITFH